MEVHRNMWRVIYCHWANVVVKMQSSNIHTQCICISYQHQRVGGKQHYDMVHKLINFASLRKWCCDWLSGQSLRFIRAAIFHGWETSANESPLDFLVEIPALFLHVCDSPAKRDGLPAKKKNITNISLDKARGVLILCAHSHWQSPKLLIAWY